MICIRCDAQIVPNSQRSRYALGRRWSFLVWPSHRNQTHVSGAGCPGERLLMGAQSRSRASTLRCTLFSTTKLKIGTTPANSTPMMPLKLHRSR